MNRSVPLWIASSVMVALATFAFAQGRLAQPQMLSGGDIGFRVESIDAAGKAQGTWMVRYNGTWLEISTSGGIRPLTK